MKLAFYSAKDFDRGAFDDYNARKGHEISYLAAHLNEESVELFEMLGLTKHVTLA